MRREGDVVVFDNDEEREHMVRIVSKSDAAEKLCSTALRQEGLTEKTLDAVLAVVGAAKAETNSFWGVAKRRLGLQAGEELSYDWGTGELSVIHQ